MADYELKNRLEWDQDLQAQHKQPAGDGEWTVAQNSRSSPAPGRAPPTRQHHQNQASRTNGSQARRTARSERVTTRRWQATHSRNLIQKPTRRGPERLGSETGNTAEAEWRTGTVPAIDHVKIPNDLCLQDKHYEQIAREHDTFVFSNQKHEYGGSRTFGIWGDRKQAAKTREAIADWIDAVWGPSKTNRASTFAKVVSLTPKLREREEMRWIREVTKQLYRQHPPPDTVFQSVGNFHWPSDEYTPEEILGASYEALDPIRMECSCYVVYRGEHRTFRIMGLTKDVLKGMAMMRKCFYQIAARQVTGPRKYLLHWPKASKMPARVSMTAYEYPSASSPKALEAQAGKSPRGMDYEDDEDFDLQSIQNDINYAKAITSILNTLPKLHYYRGNLQMRLRLGMFLVDQFRSTEDGTYSLPEYEAMIRESQFIGHVTQEVGEKHVESLLLQKFQEAEDLIAPKDCMIHNLNDVQPVIGITFTFADTRGDLCLTQEWQLGYGSEDFDRCSEKWSRLDPETGTPRTLLDVSLTNLIDGQAWQIDILASDPVGPTSLPKSLSKFAASVKILPAAARSQAVDRPFVAYNPFTSLKSIQQRVSYRFVISGTDYNLELSRFQDKTFTSPASTTKPAEHTLYEARWAINVSGTCWESNFAENEVLQIGESTTWAHDALTWFPGDMGSESQSLDGGWQQLLEKLERIEDIVKNVKASLGGDSIIGMNAD
ncbi:hypothetical protein Tdes44962_MAKER03088 [Teratosphaeria destructans]|uniref:DUF7905 domain-containing protein n=1 Tax=Teratosphaeria destructans TaxID=418781 RepID=A0A9W7SR94_9PEZI|nr:hypothetical protein Tdes44962_MAKER03088 [Teratosphaeria destructans]